MSPAIQIKDLEFHYEGNRSILEKINLQIEQNDFLIIFGPNGGGKTTLLKLMVGLIKPVSGTVLLFDQKIKKNLHRVGYLPQNTDINLNFPITVLDTVLMGWQGSRKSRFFYTKEEKQKALESLERVQMLSFAKQRIGELSGGQRQRVLIARTLVTNPSLLFLDEPIANIDPSAKNSLYELLGELNKSMTVVMVSHDISFIPTVAKSIACVHKHLHYHPAPEITTNILEMMYGPNHHECCSDLTEQDQNQGYCPVEILGHDFSHKHSSP